MTDAFPDIAEPSPSAEEPLQALAGCNQRLLRHCATLRRLVLYLGECGIDVQARGAIERLLHFFDQVLPLQHADLEQELVPALIESMAGSDAVCLHDMGDSLARGHRELRRLWLGLRPALQDVAAGRAESLPAQETEHFIAHCQSVVAHADGELLPMAQRLLLDGQLDQMAAGMRRRRSAPT